MTEGLAAEVKRYREKDGLDVRSISKLMDISMQDVTKIINSDVYKEVRTGSGDRARAGARHLSSRKNLIPVEKIIDTPPMELELGKRGKYWVHELYCGDSECSCESVRLLFLKHGEKTPVFDGYLNVNDFEFASESLHSIGEDAQAVIKEFFKDLSDSRKRVMLARFKLAKGTEEDPSEYIDFSSLRFGRCLPYKDVFRVETPEVFKVEHKGRGFVIHDQYCFNPACHCNSAILCVFESGTSEDLVEQMFAIRVGLDGGYEIKARECEENTVINFFDDVIKNNKELFTVLRERYGKMKDLGREVQKQRMEINGN
ncbi:hypothetical protein AKJ39_02995 [candidate division MSBL1 archaeon SCGC-AAA259J03]|uniref:Uncharacterized protein n=3 Tax=candidate division MSBL1 TaxID=215777 RepID=A0A656YVU4_9EURY|nr:hypothetical protein AKJ61_01945 [candidate division MSBL1 archaeon SCGC-AAA259B11]KXA95377.1 hypothetical protein AKJ36_00840 [candidate division MSBL1 archaeon SCGC-AAA259I07]KXA97774.1 hypothetical protein AKJ39_02995 [candidate division MSBL1 archaeon SCGC-AAA259J03]